MEEKVKKLEQEVEDLKQAMQTMQENLDKQRRDYTQNTTFLERVTFRGEVYDKSGTKVIN